MPTCRHCGSTYPREFFLHGNGPKTPVCVRCGVDHGLVTKEEVPVLFEKSTSSARFSTVARRYSIFLYLPFLWVLWGSTLSDVEPWGLFFLILLISPHASSLLFWGSKDNSSSIELCSS